MTFHTRLPGLRWLTLTLSVGGLTAAMASWAAPESYRYDPVHSQILFSIDHDGFSRPFGRLHIVKGSLQFDQANWSASSTALDIDVRGVDMGDAAWNAAVCKSSLLDCQHDAIAHFASTSVEQRDATHGVLHGMLTLHGASQAIDIPFRLNRVGTTIYGMHTVAGFSGTASLDRTAFGITGFPNAIGHNVTLWLELEAIRDSHSPSNGKEGP